MINQKYKDLVPPLSDEERESLKNYIKERGFKVDIITNQNGVILDGHNRFEICQELGIEPTYTKRHFNNEFEEQEFIIKNLLARRNINHFVRAELLLKLEPIEAELARQRQDAGTLASVDAKGKTSEKLAKQGNTSARTVERVKKILETGPTDIIQKARAGTLSVSSAHKIVTREERNLPKVPLPKGTFDVIYADPALRFDNRNIRGSADHHYETMSLADICSLKIPAAKNAVLFLWMPSSMFFDEVEVDPDITDSTLYWILRRWGFTPKTFFVWKKDKIGTGSWLRNQHENLIMAIKGKMPTPVKLFSSIIEAPRTEHSKKPEIVYDMIEQMYPREQYLELFARQKHSEKWIPWGNQVEAITS